MIRLLLIVSLLFANAVPGYPSGINYKTDEFSDEVVMESQYYIHIPDKIQISAVGPSTFNTAAFNSKTMDTAEKASTAVRNIFFIKSSSGWIKRINYSKKSLVLINFLIAAIIISIATMIILLIIILLNRKRMEKEEQLHQYLLENYQSLIINYLFGTVNLEEFRSIASDTYRRQVL